VSFGIRIGLATTHLQYVAETDEEDEDTEESKPVKAPKAEKAVEVQVLKDEVQMTAEEKEAEEEFFGDIDGKEHFNVVFIGHVGMLRTRPVAKSGCAEFSSRCGQVYHGRQHLVSYGHGGQAYNGEI
jgi:hypothetical protein